MFCANLWNDTGLNSRAHVQASHDVEEAYPVNDEDKGATDPASKVEGDYREAEC